MAGCAVGTDAKELLEGDFQDLLASAYVIALEQFLGVGPHGAAGH